MAVEVVTKSISVSVGSATCTKEEFRHRMVNASRDRAIGWYDPYSPILDVTDVVSTVRENVKSAKLTIFGSNLDAIRVQGPYDERPPALSTEQVVSNWERGEEWERQYCPKNGKYYWVIYPCRLEVEYKEVMPTPFEWLQQILRMLFPFLPAQQR